MAGAALRARQYPRRTWQFDRHNWPAGSGRCAVALMDVSTETRSASAEGRALAEGPARFATQGVGSAGIAPGALLPPPEQAVVDRIAVRRALIEGVFLSPIAVF